MLTGITGRGTRTGAAKVGRTLTRLAAAVALAAALLLGHVALDTSGADAKSMDEELAEMESMRCLC